MKIFSYVVDHDNGFSPNPYYGVCTLAHCKFGKKGKKNVVELAQQNGALEMECPKAATICT